MQDPLIIQKLFRKNNGHKNPGLCCSTLPVQGQNICRSFCLSFFFLNPLTFFPHFFSFPSYSRPLSLSLSFSKSRKQLQFLSGWDQTEKALFGSWSEKLSANAFVRFILLQYSQKRNSRLTERERARERQRAYSFLGFKTVLPHALKSISRYCASNTLLHCGSVYIEWIRGSDIDPCTDARLQLYICVQHSWIFGPSETGLNFDCLFNSCFLCLRGLLIPVKPYEKEAIVFLVNNRKVCPACIHIHTGLNCLIVRQRPIHTDVCV